MLASETNSPHRCPRAPRCYVALAEREHNNLTEETKDKEGLHSSRCVRSVERRKGRRSTDCMEMVKDKAEGQIQDRGHWPSKKFTKIYEGRSMKTTIYHCGSECEDRVYFHVVAECPLCNNERAGRSPCSTWLSWENDRRELCCKEIFEAWNGREKAVAVLEQA
ncbi:unnamed protein product [Ectocarpus sp. 12 AP-2014]